MKRLRSDVDRKALASDGIWRLEAYETRDGEAEAVLSVQLAGKKAVLEGCLLQMATCLPPRALRRRHDTMAGLAPAG